MHVGRGRGRRPHLRAPRPGRWSATSATSCASELSGKATIRSQAERAGLELDDEAAARAVERLKEREHRGYHYEAAPASFELLLRREAGSYKPLFKLESFRVVTEKRAGGEVETEATIKVEVDGERYVRVAEGNGPVNALDQRPARRDRRPLPAPGRDRADQLQGPDPRRSPRHRRRHPGPARLRRRRARVGHDRRLGEHHRGLLGGAGRLAGVRLPVDASVSRIDGRSRSRGRRSAPREEELVLEVLRSGRLSLGPMGERFEREFAAWLGVEDAVMVSSGTTALHLGVRALGWGAGDEVLTSPFSFVASANCLLYEGARPVFCDVDPVTLNLDPRAAAAAVGERTAGILPIHIFGYPAAMPELEALAAKHDLGILEDACEALGAVDSEGRGVGTRGNLATFAFYANKQMTTGEGGMIVPSGAEVAAAPAQRAQPGPRRRHGLARPRAASASTTASPTSPPRSASPRSRSSTRCWSAAPRSPRSTSSAWPGSRASRCRSPAAARSGAAGSSTSSASPTRSTATRSIARLGRARHRQQGLPALHPPLPAPARARLPRGPVPGRRSRRRPLAGAALLPGDERGPGGPCLSGAGGGLGQPPVTG